MTQTNRNTINKLLKNIRIRISEICEKESPFEKEEIKMDESYFGAGRVRGKKGRGAFDKIIVFGLKKLVEPRGVAKLISKLENRLKTKHKPTLASR